VPSEPTNGSHIRRALDVWCLILVSVSIGLGLTSVAVRSVPIGAAGGSIVTTSASRQSEPIITKLMVIMEENHSLRQAFPSRMPYLWSIARRYGRATSWSDIGHPSLPNYLAIFGGSAFNQPQDCLPAAGCTYGGSSVFGQALINGASARAYQESMPKRCDLSDSGTYDVNHNPWAYFRNESLMCRVNDVNSGTVRAGTLLTDIRSGSLPTVGEISPNLNHDGHDGTLAQADAWLHVWLPVLASGRDWSNGRLAIIVVFDEGETAEQVPFVILAPGMTHKVLRQPLDHFALTRLIDEVAGVSFLRQAASAPDLLRELGLRVNS
jgi:hypothetical protein